MQEERRVRVAWLRQQVQQHHWDPVAQTIAPGSWPKIYAEFSKRFPEKRSISALQQFYYDYCVPDRTVTASQIKLTPQQEGILWELAEAHGDVCTKGMGRIAWRDIAEACNTRFSLDLSAVVYMDKYHYLKKRRARASLPSLSQDQNLAVVEGIREVRQRQGKPEVKVLRREHLIDYLRDGTMPDGSKWRDVSHRHTHPYVI